MCVLRFGAFVRWFNLKTLLTLLRKPANGALTPALAVVLGSFAAAQPGQPLTWSAPVTSTVTGGFHSLVFKGDSRWQVTLRRR